MGVKIVSKEEVDRGIFLREVGFRGVWGEEGRNFFSSRLLHLRPTFDFALAEPWIPIVESSEEVKSDKAEPASAIHDEIGVEPAALALSPTLDLLLAFSRSSKASDDATVDSVALANALSSVIGQSSDGSLEFEACFDLRWTQDLRSSSFALRYTKDLRSFALD
ncbi:hypothetical protein KM043_008477 [Ampulex compressa]|nr:hypothetical protein KM043_008477 [Ampulex compressa]